MNLHVTQNRSWRIVSLILMIFLQVFFSSCAGDKSTTTENKLEEAVILNEELESFEKFLFRFAVEEEFQKSRIINNWRKGILNEDLVFKETIESKDSWGYIYLFAGLESFPIVSNPEVDEKSINKKVIKWFGIENGILISMTFERINGKWYLSEYINEST